MEQARVQGACSEHHVGVLDVRIGGRNQRPCAFDACGPQGRFLGRVAAHDHRPRVLGGGERVLVPVDDHERLVAYRELVRDLAPDASVPADDEVAFHVPGLSTTPT